MGQLANGNYRFTKANRETLAKTILKHKFSSVKFTELEQQTASLALAIYNECYSEADQTKMASITPGWLPQADSIRVSYNHGDMLVLPFNGSISNLLTYRIFNVISRSSLSTLKDVKRIATNDKTLDGYRHGELQYSVKNIELSNRIVSHIKTIKDTEKEIFDLSASVRSVIGSVTTTNRLKEVWPESKPFIENVFGTNKPKVTSMALALPISTINQKLGLPIP